MCKWWNFIPEDRPSFAYLLQQLEKFKETCASISEYHVPVRTNNGPINTGSDLFMNIIFLRKKSKQLTEKFCTCRWYFNTSALIHWGHLVFGRSFCLCSFVHWFVFKNFYIGHIFFIGKTQGLRISHKYTMRQDLPVDTKFKVISQGQGQMSRS